MSHAKALEAFFCLVQAAAYALDARAEQIQAAHVAEILRRRARPSGDADAFRAKAHAWLSRPCVVDARVDWYEVAFRVRLDRATRIALRGVQKRARKNRKSAELRLRGFVGEMLQTAKPGEYTIRNRACTVRIDLNARETLPDGGIAPGWNVRVEWRSTHLALEGPSYHASEAIALVFGVVAEATTIRGDVARTFVNWRIDKDDRERIVTRARKVADYQAVTNPGGRPRKAPDDIVHVTRHRSARHDTGFTVGQGSPISLRCYDKVADLVAKGDARWRGGVELRTGEWIGRRLEPKTEKGETEIGIWRRAGWHESLRVTRVEFQLRGEALRETKIGEITARDPRVWETPDAVDQIWRYCVGEEPPKRKRGVPREKRHGGWIRMVLPSATRRKRAAIDPRWRCAQRAFRRELPPASRRRARGPGATWTQGFGAALSYLSAGRELEEIPGGLKIVGAHLEWRTPHEQASLLSEWGARQFVEYHAARIGRDVGRAWAAEILGAHDDPRVGAEWLIERVRAARARHHDFQLACLARARGALASHDSERLSIAC